MTDAPPQGRESTLKRSVRERAGDRCEYCRFSQGLSELTFHLDHILALSHGGPDEETNAASACDRCNLFKGPNLCSVDPTDGRVVRLYDPRAERWDAHFAEVAAEIVGLTPSGRATVRLLNMNDPGRVNVRALTAAVGALPSKEPGA